MKSLILCFLAILCLGEGARAHDFVIYDISITVQKSTVFKVGRERVSSFSGKIAFTPENNISFCEIHLYDGSAVLCEKFDFGAKGHPEHFGFKITKENAMAAFGIPANFNQSYLAPVTWHDNVSSEDNPFDDPNDASVSYHVLIKLN